MIITTLFSSRKFNSKLKTRWLARSLEVFDEIGSTNNYLKSLDRRPLNGHLVISESQSTGRGQSNRVWVSDPGQNLTFSFYFKPASAKRLYSLTLIIALACSKALCEIAGKEIKVKWPNDLIIEGKKIGGILVESEFKGTNVEKLIIGIGININQTEFDGSLSNATSLKLVGDKAGDYDREEILAIICKNLEFYLDEWDRDAPLPRESVHERLIGYGSYGHVEVNESLQTEPLKFVGICTKGFPTFVTEAGDIIKYRHEQIRFYPDSQLEPKFDP